VTSFPASGHPLTSLADYYPEAASPRRDTAEYLFVLAAYYASESGRPLMRTAPSGATLGKKEEA
jgi:hypothetical protein